MSVIIYMMCYLQLDYLFISLFIYFSDESCATVLNFHSLAAKHETAISEINVNQPAHIQEPKTILKVLKFTCDVCQKRFSFKCNLKAHMLIHSGARPFECYFCKKSFAYKHVLKRHMNVHLSKMNLDA